MGANPWNCNECSGGGESNPNTVIDVSQPKIVAKGVLLRPYIHPEMPIPWKNYRDEYRNTGWIDSKIDWKYAYRIDVMGSSMAIYNKTPRIGVDNWWAGVKKGRCYGPSRSQLTADSQQLSTPHDVAEPTDAGEIDPSPRKNFGCTTGSRPRCSSTSIKRCISAAGGQC